MDHIETMLYALLHIDHYLIPFLATHGLWTYALIFGIIFAETGLIIVPFLPGDSLLFTLGSIAALPESPLHIVILLLLLIIASILGNQVNYIIGRLTGPKVFSMDNSLFFNKNHLNKAHQFYEKHGGKTIIMARFIPIIRTFAPFVAGVSQMKSHPFTLYNISSAILWIGSLLSMGYFLGSIPFIKEHFSIVIYAIIVISFMPPLLTILYQRIVRPASS